MGVTPAEHAPRPRHYAAALLDDAVGRWPAREALVGRGLRWSYAELASTVRGLAAALGGLVAPGEDVAVLSGNRPEYLALQFAVHLLGCRLVVVPPAISSQAMEQSLRGIRPAALVFDPQGHTDLAERLNAVAAPRHLLSLGPCRTGVDLLAELTTQAAQPPPATTWAETDADAVKTVFLTSGTTGYPKPVVHGHGLYTVLSSLLGDTGLAAPGERRLVVTPLTFISGHFCLPTLMSGGTLVLHERYDAGAALAAIAAEHIGTILLTNVMLDQLLDHPRLAETDLSSLRRIQYGASRPSPRRVRLALQRFGPILQQLYGMTEAGPVSLLQPADHDPTDADRLASAGYPVPGVRLAVRREDGSAAAPGELGEVLVRGSGVMEGYVDPAVPAAVRDGWLHTGDLGRLDPDGRLHVVERLKEVILHAGTGLRVWSREVEEVLLGHPTVRAAAVIGIPAETHGEWLHAVVVPAPGAVVDEQALRAHVFAVLGQESMVPARIHAVEAFPLTAMSKVDKAALRQRYTPPRADAL
ncbi:fatty-acyl-CoA synthase [Kitasatospora sp. GP30]|uniref:AMP-binding protein n=1 Tax=Kitasatospora sp. GP30 TaxID=3035084 RepID=UPI000C6FED49|nr:AMP-binding protein [Kitasatospora sp. GP30]MDH6142423.1 fatty-acyl-CoA synthase [Kitasatospora sp. GP30]